MRTLTNIPLECECPRMRMPMPMPMPIPQPKPKPMWESHTDILLSWDCIFECPATGRYGSVLFINTAMVDAFRDRQF